MLRRSAQSNHIAVPDNFATVNKTLPHKVPNIAHSLQSIGCLGLAAMVQLKGAYRQHVCQQPRQPRVLHFRLSQQVGLMCITDKQDGSLVNRGGRNGSQLV